MSEPRDILDLVFEREHLNIVVIGPGYGEAVVVGLPGAGWLVIDGAGRSSGRDYPVHQLLEHHIGSDVIEAMLLTHPHGDHYRGMRELIDHPTLGPRLRRLGCVRKLVDDDTDSMGSDILRDVGAVRELLERIKSWWAAHPVGAVTLCAGPLPLGHHHVDARVLAPDVSFVDEFLRHEGRRERIRQRANELSVVLELRFGTGRYLFTGDLPEPRWRALLEHEKDLHEHDLLKLPHHGSENAQPLGLLRRRTHEGARAWVVTPFNRGTAGSRPPTRGGLAALLVHHEPVHMTSFPTAWSQTNPAPPELELGALEVAPVRWTGPKGRVTQRGVRPELRMRDCFWLFSFDDNGQLIRSERGRAATRIRAGR